MDTRALQQAVDAALGGDWDRAHGIAQNSSHPLACWIHAVLHKIEGDEGNSRYWYARAQRSYETYSDPTTELKAIAAHLAESVYL
jgi:hypothetical protein